MATYNRKGGSRVKSGSLRQQFNYYKRQVKNRLIEEYTGQRARGLTPIGIPKTLFKHLNYQDIITHGITRKQGGKTIRIKGEEAVKIQIESLRLRASKNYQANLYISNYLQTMFKTGFDYELVEKVSNAFSKISNDKLTYLINTGILKPIEFLYNEDIDEYEYTEDIINTILTGATGKDYKLYQERKKSLLKIATEEFRILGGIT